MVASDMLTLSPALMMSTSLMISMVPLVILVGWDSQSLEEAGLLGTHASFLGRNHYINEG